MNYSNKLELWKKKHLEAKGHGKASCKSEHGKDQNYGLRHKPVLTQRLRKTALCCVS